METINIVTWIMAYTALATILFNASRSVMRLNLPSSIILTASLSFLAFRIPASKSFYAWVSEYIWALIIFAILINIIVVFGRRPDESDSPKNDMNSTEPCKRQRKEALTEFTNPASDCYYPCGNNCRSHLERENRCFQDDTGTETADR